MLSTMYEIGNILFLLCPEKIWSTEDDLARWSDILTKSCNEKLKHENLILMNCDSVGNHNNYKILGKSVVESEGYFMMNSNRTEDIVKEFISQHEELGVSGMEPLYLSSIELVLPVRERFREFYFYE